jgi:PAS domain S-box-containing protein
VSVEKLAQKINDVRWRLVALQGQTYGAPLRQQDLLTEAFEEFQTTLEELLVAEEELCAANEEMAATRAEVEIERQRYQDLFEFAPDGYLVTDTNGVIQEANCAVAQLLNVSPKFLVGKPLYLFFAQEVRDELFAKLLQLQQVNFAQEWEVRLQPRNNTPFSAGLTVAAIRKPDGDLTGLRWLLRDISDRKKAELQEVRTALSPTCGKC